MITKNYDNTRPGMLFFEGETAAATATEAMPPVPAGSSPTGQTIPTIPISTENKPAPETVQPAPLIKQKGILDVKKALGLDKKPSALLNEEAAELRQRSRKSTVIPVPKIKSKEDKPTPTATEKPEKTETPPAAAPAPAAEQPKIKIGEKEMTAEEVAKYVADLEKKAKPPEQPAGEQLKPAAGDKPEQTDEQKAAATKQADEQALAKITERYTTTEDELDTILSGGKPAVALFAKRFAQTEMNTRKWVEQTLNPILRDLHESMAPMLKMHSEVAQYQAEASFFAKHADLAPHRKTVRTIDEALRTKYPSEYHAMTQEQRDSEIAEHARAMIKEFGGTLATPEPAPAASPNAAKPAAAPPTPQKQPPAPKANLTSSSAPAAVNPQRAMINKLIASGK